MKVLPNKFHLNLFTGTLHEFTNYLEVIEVQDPKRVICLLIYMFGAIFYLISLFLCIRQG